MRTAGGAKGWIFGPPLVALAATLVMGCANEAMGEEPTLGTVEQKIIGGAKDIGALASSGVVALKVGPTGAKDFELCSAAFIAPNLLLTARHCVGNPVTDQVSCDENGRSTNGNHVNGNRAPEEIAVYRGASPKFGGEPDARATTILSPEGGSLCDTDIALVVLDRSFDDVEPLAIRMGGTAVSAGENIRSVGYGANDSGAPIGTRFRKDDVAVLAVGSGVSQSKTALGPHEFEVGQAICPGDSGGPAINEETGAIIGVVSRGSDASCKSDFGNIYTSTVGWDDLFAKAFAAAGGAPIVETGTPTVTGATLQSRNVTSTPANDAKAEGGCAASPRGGRSSAIASFGLVVAAAMVRRRRRAG